MLGVVAVCCALAAPTLTVERAKAAIWKVAHKEDSVTWVGDCKRVNSVRVDCDRIVVTTRGDVMERRCIGRYSARLKDGRVKVKRLPRCLDEQ